MFTPFTLTKNVQLEHRITMPPLTRARANYNDGVFGPNTKEYYGQRATEGGLLISEATLISPVARGWDRAPGIWLDEHVNMWKDVTAAVHEKKGYIYCQLWHMGRASHPSLQPNGQPPKGPSAVATPGAIVFGKGNEMHEMTQPDAFTPEEIVSTIQDYYNATVNAKAAGFDGIELHSANGYLLQQFYSTNANIREDQYGGSIENRCRFTLEVANAVARAWLGLPITATVEEVKEAVIAQYGEADAPIDIAIRISPGVKFNSLEEPDAEELYPYLLEQFNQLPAKMSYVHIVEPRADGVEDAEKGEKSNYENSKNYARKYFKGAVMSAGGYSRDPESGHETINAGAADLIAIGRAYIPNPDLVFRLKEGIPLRPWDRDQFYTAEEVIGYIDYAAATEEEIAEAKAKKEAAAKAAAGAKKMCC